MRNKHEDIEFWNRPENKLFDLEQYPKCNYIYCNLYLQTSNRFKCFHCNKVYCSEHSLIYNHKCPKIDSEKSNNTTFEKIILPKCSFKECNVKMDLCNRFKCQKCEKIYCSSHRIDFTHLPCSNDLN